MNEETVTKLRQAMDVILQIKNDVKLENQFSKLANKSLLDTADLCVLFQVGAKCIKSWRDKKILPYTKISGKCFYLWSDVVPLLGKQ